MHLVSYNIQFGRGKDGRVDLERVAAEVESADVIAMQEVDRFWRRSDMADQVAVLAEHLPDHHWVYGPGIDVDASERDADGRLTNRRRQFGNLLLSRLPILSARTHFLPKQNLHNQPSLQRTALEGLIDFPQGPVRVYSVHLAHVSPLERREQIERILAIHGAARAEGAVRTRGAETSDDWDADGPPPPATDHAILLGDFNMTPDMAAYPLLGGVDVRRYGRVARQDGFVDAWIAAGEDPAGGHTKFEATENRRIDYAFVSAPLADRIRAIRVDADAQGSDHQPLWLDIGL